MDVIFTTRHPLQIIHAVVSLVFISMVDLVSTYYFGNQLTLMKKQHEYNEASANSAQKRAIVTGKKQIMLHKSNK